MCAGAATLGALAGIGVLRMRVSAADVSFDREADRRAELLSRRADRRELLADRRAERRLRRGRHGGM